MVTDLRGGGEQEIKVCIFQIFKDEWKTLCGPSQPLCYVDKLLVHVGFLGTVHLMRLTPMGLGLSEPNAFIFLWSLETPREQRGCGSLARKFVFVSVACTQWEQAWPIWQNDGTSTISIISLAKSSGSFKNLYIFHCLCGLIIIYLSWKDFVFCLYF